MKKLFQSLTQLTISLITSRTIDLVSALFLASFSLWDIFDQLVFEGKSPFGVEHGVAAHGVIMLIKSGFSFRGNTSKITKEIQKSKNQTKRKEE
jgi:hypothetical protein